MKICSSIPLFTPTVLGLVVAFYDFDAVASFLIKDSISSPTHAVVRIKPEALPFCTLKVGGSTASEDTNNGNDEYDDFYNDFDPSNYEDFDQVSEEYTRDVDADNSDVDLEIITELITKRSEMKKTRQFDEADKIRDELLANYGILVRDKDRKWRTGCSESQNHSKWLHGDNLIPRGDFKSRDDFGPNGHDYVLAKDAGPNISSMSEETIHELLAKRLSCKFDRDYDAADAIQAELLSAGVLIDGKARRWRADGQFFSSFAPREYKMLPHNYDLSKDLKEIEKLVQERSICRAERLFTRSDEIREELFQKFDVRINDKMQSWSVGGNQSWGRTKRPYEISDRSKVPNDVGDIEKLVEERDIARENRDFAEADAIRNQLLEKSIIVDDKKRIWYVGKVSKIFGKDNPNAKQKPPYIRRGGGDLSAEKMDEIESLVDERDMHKLDKQYNDADVIRNRLLNEYGVQVDDGNREWYIISNEYLLAHDSAEIDDETRILVQQKIQDRTIARGEKDYEKADTIKKVLFKKHNVVIDDRMREWSVIKSENLLS
jgi:cysteinyl-tRNA synthetase